ncbi:MAG: hypothetical protein OIF48_08610 [Silicimonas sp.]|nr:hypothetical protein [Silicimonas sp.]
MSNTLKTVLALGLFTLVAACQQEEAVMVDPIEPEAPMSKY